MEDCCVVCAEPLEWIGYGPCGHREVCYACVARLRFVLDDKNCCICKQECPTVYVTKALGEYTRVVTDWTPLLSHSTSRRQSNLWYDHVVEAYFDDEEPFKTIKAMCRLYCSICEKGSEGEAGTKGVVRKGYTFKNIGSLRRHQSIVHKVYMCGLCLEGRKIFVSEQKLFSKAQLRLHSRKGASVVDGNEDERGGFDGHPMCSFCRRPFYGDNELYQHMTQDHYSCHMCQRARPGHFEYYRDYDDLEAHFRRGHSLCEHPECLAKKFVVFLSEADLKRHDATTHGGHMTRSQRNAALQVPVAFQHRQNSAEDSRGSYSSRRGGRGGGGGGGGGGGDHPYPVQGRSDQFIESVTSGVEAANLENAVRESLHIAQGRDESGGITRVGADERPNTANLESVASQSEVNPEIRPSRYLAAVGGAGRSPSLAGVVRSSSLGDVAFPPLPGPAPSAPRQPNRANQGPASLMAALLRNNRSGRNARAGIRVLNAADYRSPSVPT